MSQSRFSGSSPEAVQLHAEESVAAESSSDSQDLVGQVLAGRYRVEALLGAGGMGAVYRARHVHMRKVVALKVLHREMTYNPEMVARFEREAVAAARIDHPNVASATDFGRLDDGTFYLVLEFVEGQSLSRALKAGSPFTDARAVHIARQISDALSAAHASKIVHRDLKPDNVMLVEREEDPDFVKVLDFGIAKVRTDDMQDQPALTQAGAVFGTPEYMAPEQARGDTVDARADLYTLGMILYEMLVGETPFADDDLLVVLTRQLTMEAPALPEHIDSELSALVQRLLKKNPAERIQDAQELTAQLSAIEDRLFGVASRPPSLLDIDVDATGETALSLPRPKLSSLERSSQSLEPGSLSDARVIDAASVPGPLSSAGLSEPDLGRRPQASTPGSAGIANVGRTLNTFFDRYPSMQRPVKVGQRRLPLWVLALPAFALCVGFVVTLFALSGTDAEAETASAKVNKVEGEGDLSRRLEAMVENAEKGDRQALAELKQLPDAERTAVEWRALGRGYAVIRMYDASLDAYKRGIQRDAALSEDPQLIRDVYKAISDPAHAKAALQLAAESLGSVGADMVYEFYTETKGERGKAELRKLAKELIEKDSFRKAASPSLAIALDLSDAKGCSAYKELMPRAAKYADERSLSTLKRLGARRGCGFLGLSDCYSCLRRGSELKDATERAKATPGPSFAEAAPAPAASASGAAK